MSTKEQERKALAKIKKIIADLGEDSYLKNAFEGCYEIAERNIDDDAAYSLTGELSVEIKLRETAEKREREMRKEMKRLSLDYEMAKRENEALKETLTEDGISDVLKMNIAKMLKSEIAATQKKLDRCVVVAKDKIGSESSIQKAKGAIPILYGKLEDYKAMLEEVSKE